MLNRSVRLAGVICVVALSAARATEATVVNQYIYRVLFDTDLNAATGCDVAVEDAFISTTIHGIDQIVTVTVQRTTTSGTVTAITRSICVSGSTFGAPQPVSPGTWPVGQDDGVGGADVIEGFVPRGALGNPAAVRVVFTSTRDGSASDVMLTINGTVGAAPIVFALGGAAPVPALSATGLPFLALLLGGVAYWGLRRRLAPPRALGVAVLVALTIAAAVWAATIIMDGQVNDWAGLGPICTDPIGDSSNHDPAEDMVAGFMTTDATNIYFRIDVVDIETGSPIATPTPTATDTPTPTPTPTATPCGDLNQPCCGGDTCNSGSICGTPRNCFCFGGTCHSD